MDFIFSDDLAIYALISLSYFFFLYHSFNYQTFSKMLYLMTVFISGVFAVATFGLMAGIFILIFGSLMIVM
jgi:hypothetical protein